MSDFDLIVRGHRLVADDTVEIRRRAETILIGTCPELTRHHMELRGLGVINIKELFGIASTRSSKRLELVVQLERWVPTREYERLGLDDAYYEILGLRVPLLKMPVAPGRNIAILVEVAARNQLLRQRGHHVHDPVFVPHAAGHEPVGDQYRDLLRRLVARCFELHHHLAQHAYERHVADAHAADLLGVTSPLGGSAGQGVAVAVASLAMHAPNGFLLLH